MRDRSRRHPSRSRDFRISLLAGAAVLAWSAGAAAAADLPAPAPVPTFAQYSWAGFYAGVRVGYDWGHDHLVESVTATGVPTGSVYDYHPDGVAGGIHLGYNFQYSSVVLGVVTDFEGSSASGRFLDPSGIGRGHDEVDWKGSLRGKLGYSFGSVLPYVTGGLAYQHLENTYVFVPTGVSETFSSVPTGWTVGAGLDYGVTRNLFTTLEYRHSDYGSFTNVSTRAFPGLSGRTSYETDEVKVGASYRF